MSGLGITDVYASPILRSRPGSAHGYDVTDPTHLNPELGGEEEFEALVEELKRQGMGLLLDIVPNHMAASVDNPWWADVLEHGQSSPYSPYFDIDWEGHPEGRIVLPILSAPLEEVLKKGALTLGLDEHGFFVRYEDIRLPLSHATSAAVRRANRSQAGMAAVLAKQAYELAYWRDGVERLNYRRFFDITSLIGVRVEEPAVFEATHKLILRLVRGGKVTGLRVDHIDGLRDPLGYLQRLQEAVSRDTSKPYVLVEKILLSDETLPEEWPASGTTGYEFASIVNGLFIDEEGLRALDTTYRRFTGSRASFVEIVYEKKKKVMQELFAGELHALSAQLAGLARAAGLDQLTPQQLREALVEVSTRLPVYRTYTRDMEVSPRDRAFIDQVVEEGCRRTPGLDEGAVDFVRSALLLDVPHSLPPAERQRWLDFVTRWQQFTGPVTAKGLEDTALYNYNRLISLNEVGGDPAGTHVPAAIERFHRHNARTLSRWRQTLNTTSTHDTKRSEDVRARIDVLSEMPRAWARRLNHWSRLNRGKKPSVNGQAVPDPVEETLLYQTLVGGWPLNVGEVPEFHERLKAFVVKAAREAKAHTSWLDPDEAYESALASFVEATLEDSARSDFLADFLRFQESIAYYGALNSLSQTLLKVTSPGVPDFYQGTELWDFSLVDPDNRRPVDFTSRVETLRGLQSAEASAHTKLVRDLIDHWQDGRIKMYVIARALAFRRAHAALFQLGHYLPLQLTGGRSEHVVAFARRQGDDWAVVAAPRLFAGLCRPGRRPAGQRTWKDTALSLPPGAPDRWFDVLTSERIDASRLAGRRVLPMAGLFWRLPIAVLSCAAT